MKTLINILTLFFDITKGQIYWKEQIGFTVFMTILYACMFCTIWFNHANDISRNLAHLATFGWIFTILLLLWSTKWKK